MLSVIVSWKHVGISEKVTRTTYSPGRKSSAGDSALSLWFSNAPVFRQSRKERFGPECSSASVAGTSLLGRGSPCISSRVPHAKVASKPSRSLARTPASECVLRAPDNCSRKGFREATGCGSSRPTPAAATCVKYVIQAVSSFLMLSTPSPRSCTLNAVLSRRPSNLSRAFPARSSAFSDHLYRRPNSRSGSKLSHGQVTAYLSYFW
mmetsp:Transcript_20717/g.57307  ORF Transcript_20717/g.57307 Transcript_20717/m.57307 type:complete len:207 (-) Transcript_20717:2591-3211(-)